MQRRTFLKSTALSSAFLGLSQYLHAAPAGRATDPYGPLVRDPEGLLDLPRGFRYRVLSRTGNRMSDGFKVPGQPDGMAAFAGPEGKVILLCNHELSLAPAHLGPFDDHKRFRETLARGLCFDPGGEGEPPHLGGTTTLVYDPAAGQVEKHFLSLIGTDRNCAGGAMPWGTWITCEESENLTSTRGRKHGYCFEVAADPESGLQKAVPLKSLGRFRHEAVALDPATGILYLTEDRNDGLLYRFVPARFTPGQRVDFSKGRLQALGVNAEGAPDLRNYDPRSRMLEEGVPLAVHWIDMTDIDAPRDDLRHRGFQAGAVRFARSEGIHYAEGKLYLCATDGGPTRQGQIFLFDPAQDTLELFLQAGKSDLLNNGDNLTVSPQGDLIICEDLINEHSQETPHLRGITPEGKIFTLARNAANKSEFAGSTFSPDGTTLFVNIQSPGITLAIMGPWNQRDHRDSP